jgi:hypothetical protein
MFKQACLIKKNTKFLRNKLERIGYKYVNAMQGTDDNYNNLNEPWILCLFDSYILCDEMTYNGFKEEFINTQKPDFISNDIKEFSHKQSAKFLEEVAIKQ